MLALPPSQFHASCLAKPELLFSLVRPSLPFYFSFSSQGLDGAELLRVQLQVQAEAKNAAALQPTQLPQPIQPLPSFLQPMWQPAFIPTQPWQVPGQEWPMLPIPLMQPPQLTQPGQPQ